MKTIEPGGSGRRLWAVGLAAIGLAFVPPGDSTQGEASFVSTETRADTGAVRIQVASHNELGEYLTDGEGRAVYLFKADTAGESTCYDRCAGAWPPVIADGEPEAGEGAQAAMIGTTQRRDGSSQVTYNDWPLYYFTQDTEPNSVKGQDKSGFGAEWYLVSPSGEEVHEEGIQMREGSSPPQSPRRSRAMNHAYTWKRRQEAPWDYSRRTRT